VVHSEFGKGTTFTFLFALENDENIVGGQVMRIMNPQKKAYAKIKMGKKKKDQ